MLIERLAGALSARQRHQEQTLQRPFLWHRRTLARWVDANLRSGLNAYGPGSQGRVRCLPATAPAPAPATAAGYLSHLGCRQFQDSRDDPSASPRFGSRSNICTAPVVDRTCVHADACSVRPFHAPGQALKPHVRHHGQHADHDGALQHIGGVETAQAHDDG